MSAQARHSRSALTLLELLVVLAIIAVLVALLVPAVQRIRAAALHVESSNNVKQIALAFHGYENTNQRLPVISVSLGSQGIELSFFTALLPYLEQGSIYQAFNAQFGSGGATSDFSVPTFVSPLDPTTIGNGGSYAANGTVFNRRRKLISITDGTSNTIGLAEHYSYGCGGTIFVWIEGKKNGVNNPPLQYVGRRATFADKAMGDVHPLSQGGETLASVPGNTFQLAPAVADCNPALAQAASSRGLLAGLMDGSVRTLAHSISERTFWSALTPDRGETLGADW